MAEYHVGCGAYRIYAGTMDKERRYWVRSSNVTNEAILAVMEYMRMNIPKDSNGIAYAIKSSDGKYLRLKLEVADRCPEWAKEALGEV